jgi:hypothetical protein
MQLDHLDYTRLVIAAYKKKRANGELSLLLSKSSPAKIKKACLNLYKKQYDNKEEPLLRKDQQILIDFLERGEQGTNFLPLIKKFERDKFKPLDNYLKEETEKTDHKNIELLAWLIDFKYRPCISEKEVQLSEEELSVIKSTGTKPIPQGPVNNNEQGKEAEDLKEAAVEVQEVDNEPVSIPLLSISPGKEEQKKSKRVAIVFLLLLVCSGVTYAVWQQMGKAESVCAYWAGDHYEEVSCNEDPKGRPILAMNPEKVKSFRKIIRQDTITERSIGSIYYIKNNNAIECYTQGGNYPKDITRSLKILTRRMFDKYILKKDTARLDSLPE